MRPETVAFAEGNPVRAFVRSVERYPYHWHDALEIVQVLQGSVHIAMGNDNLLLRERDVAVINMGELHRITKSQEENQILLVHIDDRFYRSILPETEYHFLWCCSPYHEAQAPEKYGRLKDQLAQLIRALCDELGAEDVRELLRSMLTGLAYSFDFLRWGYGTTPFDDRRVQRLRQLAEQAHNRHDVNLGLKGLAAEVGVSLYHLSHEISAQFGATFQELVAYGKCERAARLLLGTDRRIVDIALECGFSDQKYLIKHFKGFFGLYPSVFRQQHRADAASLAAQVQYHDMPLSDALKYLGPR